MLKSILDTDILSEYLKGHNRIVAGRAADYARQYGVFTFTSVTVHEIVFGLEVKGAASQLQKALAWLNQNEEITPTAAGSHGNPERPVIPTRQQHRHAARSRRVDQHGARMLPIPHAPASRIGE